MQKKPEILKTHTIAETRLFSIQQISLQFSNGEQRDYERIEASSKGAVLIIPLVDDQTVLMIKEYSVGTHRYELVFPKGRMDGDESIENAADRELREEIGQAAKRLIHLHSMTIAPGYLGFSTHVVLAEGLHPAPLEGDEPEPLEVVSCRLDQLDQLLQRPDLTEARSIAALYMVRDLLAKRTADD